MSIFGERSRALRCSLSFRYLWCLCASWDSMGICRTLCARETAAASHRPDSAEGQAQTPIFPGFRKSTRNPLKGEPKPPFSLDSSNPLDSANPLVKKQQVQIMNGDLPALWHARKHLVPRTWYTCVHTSPCIALFSVFFNNLWPTSPEQIEALIAYA
jgi:hypothetical protein